LYIDRGRIQSRAKDENRGHIINVWPGLDLRDEENVSGGRLGSVRREFGLTRGRLFCCKVAADGRRWTQMDADDSIEMCDRSSTKWVSKPLPGQVRAEQDDSATTGMPTKIPD
jgi:hypothetical protein